MDRASHKILVDADVNKLSRQMDQEQNRYGRTAALARQPLVDIDAGISGVIVLRV
jgi:hypothetical protein